MSITVIRPKGRAEWLEHRKEGIGSSEISTIVGLNPYQSPYQLWLEKKGLAAPKEETFAMKAGHYLEDAVTRFWADESKREVIKASAGDWLYVNKEKPFLRVSPDRTFWIPGMPRNQKNKGILECKTTQMTIDPDDLPKHWFCQLQYLLGVSDTEQGSLAWLCGGRSFGYKDIKLVPGFYGWMIEEAEKFWVDYILANKEPEVTCVDDILIKYNQHTDGKYLEATPEILNDLSLLKEVREQISQLEVQKDHLEAKIKLFIQDAEGISTGGETVVTWKTSKPSVRFDSKSFTRDHPELAKEYSNTQPGSRRFTIK